MAPQFVDFNADGHIDIFTATFDGSPHIAYGSEKGFVQPEHLLDSQGRRILLDQFWNYDSEAWEFIGRGSDGGAQPKDQCISALAFDWDGDGDFDVILGEYHTGRLYRQMNEGKPGEPRFTGVNIPIEVDGKEHAIEKGMTAPQLVDWDGDGLQDLLVGGFGDCWGKDTGGGVWIIGNAGKVGAPAFGAPLAVIELSDKSSAQTPLRPDAGLYANAVDYDGDGDLDLLVGGYTMWQPAAPVLSKVQEARADELAAQIEGDMAEQRKLSQKALAGVEDRVAAYSELRSDAAYKSLTSRLKDARDELETLRPSAQREAAVWLYRRVNE